MWDVTNLYGGYIVVITTTVAAVVTITILVVTYRCYRLRKLQLQDISNKKTTAGTRVNKSIQKKIPELERKSSNPQAQKLTSISNYSPKDIASRRDDVSSSSSGRRKKRKKGRAGIEKDDDGTEDAVDKPPDDDPLSELYIIRDDKRVSNTHTETPQQVIHDETSNEIALDDAIAETGEIKNGNTVHTQRLSENSLSGRLKKHGKTRADHKEEVVAQDVSETYKPTEDASSCDVDIIRGDRRVSKTSTETIQQLIHVEATHIATFDIPETEEMIISENGRSTHNLKASDNSIDFLQGGSSTSLINSPSGSSISKLGEDSKLEPPKSRSCQKKAKKFADISVPPQTHKSDVLKSGLNEKEKTVRDEKNEEIVSNSRKNSKSPSNITKATKNVVDGTATKTIVTFIRNEIWEKKTPLPIDRKIGPNSQNRETERSENKFKEVNLASNSPNPVNGNIFPTREVAVHLNNALEQKNMDQLPSEPVSSKKTGKMKNRNKAKFTTMEMNTSAIKIISDITDRNVTPVFRVSDVKEEKNHLNKDTDAIQHETEKSTPGPNEIQEGRSDDIASWQQSKITKNDPSEDKENTFVEPFLNHPIRISTDSNGELKNSGMELAETTAITKPHQSDNITKQKEKKIDMTRIKTNNNESALVPEASCQYIDYKSTVKASAKETNKSQLASQDNSVDSPSSSNKQKEAISTNVPKAVRLPGRHRNEKSHHIVKHATESSQDGAREVLSDEATTENAVPPSSIFSRAAQYQLPNEDDSTSPSWKLEQGNAHTNKTSAANMHSGTKKKNESTPVFTGPKYSAGRAVCPDQQKTLTDTSVAQREISPKRNMEPEECNEYVTSPFPIPTKELVKHLHETRSAYPETTTPIQREVTEENQSNGSKIVELPRTQVARVELPCKVTKSTDESFPISDSRTTSHSTSTLKPTESESNSTEKLNRRAQLDEKPVFFMTTSTELKPSSSKTKQKAKGLVGKKNKSLAKKEEVYSIKNNERNIPSTMHSTTDGGHEPNDDNIKTEYRESDSPLVSSTMKKPLQAAPDLVAKQSETNDTQSFTTKDDGRENAELDRKQYETLNTEPYSTHSESNNAPLHGPKKSSQKSPLLTGAQGKQDTRLGTEEGLNSSKPPQAAPDLVAEQNETNDTQSFTSKDDSGEKAELKRKKSPTMNKEPYSTRAQSNNTPLPGPSNKSPVLTGAQGKQDTCLDTVERLTSDFDGSVTKSTDDWMMEVNSNHSKHNARADVLGSTKTSPDQLTIAEASQNRLSIAGVGTENLRRQTHKLEDQILDSVEENEKCQALTDDRQITQTQNVTEHEHVTAMVNSRMENIDFQDRFVNTDLKDDTSKLVVDLNKGKDSNSDEFRAKPDSLDRQEIQIDSQDNLDSEPITPTTVVDRMDSPTTTVRQVEAQRTGSEEITPVSVTERSSRQEFHELRAKPIPTETVMNPALDDELLFPQPEEANSYHINWTGAEENQSEQQLPETRKIDNLFGKKQDKNRSVYGVPLDREYKQSETSSVNRPTKSSENWRKLDTHSPQAKDSRHHKISPTERSENNDEKIPFKEKKYLADDNRGKSKYENRQIITEAQLSLKSNNLLKNETEVAPKEYKEVNLYPKAVPEEKSLETRSQRMPLEIKSHQLSSQNLWSSHEERTVHKGMTKRETENQPQSASIDNNGACNTASKAIRVRNKPVQFETVIHSRSESHTQSFIQPRTVDEDEEYSLKTEDKPEELEILGENKLIQDDSAASIDQTEKITENTDIPETTQVSADSHFTAKNSAANDHTPEALSSLFGKADGEHKLDEIDEVNPNQPIIHDNKINPLLFDADILAKDHLKGTRNPADHTRIIPNDSLPHNILHERDAEIDATGQTLMDDEFTERIDGHILSEKKSNEHEHDEDRKTHFDNAPEYSKDNECTLNLGIKPETTSSEYQQVDTVIKINKEQNLNLVHKVLSDVKETISHPTFSNEKYGEETIAERALGITEESTPLGIHSDPEKSAVDSECENFENQNVHERAGSDFNRVKILSQDTEPKFITPKNASGNNGYGQCRSTNTPLALHDHGALGDSIYLPRRELEKVSKMAAAITPENRNFYEPNFEVVKKADRRINEAEFPQKPFENTDNSNASTPNENWHEYKPEEVAATITDAMRSEDDSNRTGNLRLSEKDSRAMPTSSVSSVPRTSHHHIVAYPRSPVDKDGPNTVELLTSIQEGTIGIETKNSEQMHSSSPEKCETTERFNYDTQIGHSVEGYCEVHERIPTSVDGTLISPTEKPTTVESRCSENLIKLSIVNQDESSFVTMEEDVNKNGTDKPLESFENQPNMNTVEEAQMPDSVTLMNTEKHVAKHAETEQEESNKRKSKKKHFRLQGVLGNKTNKEVPGYEGTEEKIEHQSPSTQGQPEKQVNTLRDTTTNQELDKSQTETSALFNSVVKSSVSANDLVRKDEVSGSQTQPTDTIAGSLISSKAPDFRKNTGDQPINCLKHEPTNNLMSPRRNNSEMIASDDAPSLPTNKTPEKLVPPIVGTEARQSTVQTAIPSTSALLAHITTTNENTQTGANTKTDNSQFRLEDRTCTENDESKPVGAEAVLMGTEPLDIRNIQKDNAQVELKSDPSSTVALVQVGKSKEPFTKGLDYPDSPHLGHVRMNNADTLQPANADLPSENMPPSIFQENSLIPINRNEHAYSNDQMEVSHEVPAIAECDIGQNYESEAIPDFVSSTQKKDAQDANMPISSTEETAEMSTVPSTTVDSFTDNPAESTAQPKTLLGSHGSLNPPVITVQLEPPSLTPNDVDLHVKSPKNKSKLKNLFGKKKKTEDNTATPHKKSENHDSEFPQQKTDKPKKRILKNIFKKKKKSNSIPQLGTNSPQPELLQPGTPSSSSGTGSLSITRFDASISSISDESCTGKSCESAGPALGVISSNLETPVVQTEHNPQKPTRNKRLNDFPISEESSYDESPRRDPREQSEMQTVTGNASDQPTVVNIEGRDDLVNTNLPEYTTSTLQLTNANESVTTDDDSMTEVRALQHGQEILQANEEEGDVCSTGYRKSSTVDDSIMRDRALMPTADEPEFDMNESDKISDHGSAPAPASNRIPEVQEEFEAHTREITQQSVPTVPLAGLPHDKALDMSFESSIATSSGISESERSENESKKRPQKKKSLLKMKNPFRKDKHKDTSDTEKYTSKSPINTLAEKMPSGLVSLFSSKKKDDDSSLTSDKEQVTLTTPKEKKKTKLSFLRKKQVKSVDSETDEEAIKPSQQTMSLLSPPALPTPNLTSYETSDDQYESDASVMKAGYFSQHDSSSGMSTATLSDVSQKTLCMDWKVSNTMRAHYMRLAWESILGENLACMCINSGTSWSYYAVVKGVVWPIKLKFGRCTYVKVVVTSSDKVKCRQMGEIMRQVIVRKKTPQCRSRAKHLWRHLTQYLQTRNIGVLVFTTDDVNRWGVSLPTSGQYCYTNWENYLYFAWLP